MEITPNFLVQIDTLILTPTQAILLEIKNYASTIRFDALYGKTTKISPDAKIEKFDCIIHPLNRAAIGLQKSLTERYIHLKVIMEVLNNWSQQLSWNRRETTKKPQ